MLDKVIHECIAAAVAPYYVLVSISMHLSNNSRRAADLATNALANFFLFCCCLSARALWRVGPILLSVGLVARLCDLLALTLTYFQVSPTSTTTAAAKMPTKACLLFWRYEQVCVCVCVCNIACKRLFCDDASKVCQCQATEAINATTS